MNLYSLKKRSLGLFLVIYFGAITITIIGFTSLLYKMEIKNLQERFATKLHNQATTIAFRAIDAQMIHKPFFIDKEVAYLLLDSNNHPIKGTFKLPQNIEQEFTIIDGCAYYVEKGAKGHLGIDTIIVRDCSYKREKRAILYKNLLIAILSFIPLLAIGWYLGKLFLRPWQKRIQELDRFIKDSTHELNTPVTTIMLALSKLKEQSRYTHIAKMSTLRITKLYEDLTYINFGSNTTPEQIDIKEIIEQLLHLFCIMQEHKKITLQTKLSSCTIQADPKEIELLLKNLIDNAYKYAPINSTITISLESCQFTITNSLASSLPKDVESLFERYTRGSNSSGGFGIGLSIVKTVCQKYNFSIKVSTKRDQITFTLFFK